MMGIFYKIKKLLGLAAWASGSAQAVPSASYPCLRRRPADLELLVGY
ncbi:MAG: hypothetical protein GF308_04845 [Candidatus Heimdallarchaeota archaeon]|nr:hypothetical protein [Candidatus Heimdallarchaeota archaeon]